LYLKLARDTQNSDILSALQMKYKTLKTSVPRYLSQRINRRVNARTLCSSATPLLIQPFARTDFAKRSFQCAAPSVWNSLPVSVIGSDSLSVFKSRLKLSYFVSPITSTHNPLPPAPSKLRPYGVLQICLLLLLLLLVVVKFAMKNVLIQWPRNTFMATQC